MDIKKYFGFSGRINRAKYFWIPFLVGIPIAILGVLAQYSENIFLLLLALLFEIASAILSICLTVQRLHDIERPGTHWWLLLIPLYNIYLGLVLLFKPGTDGPNMYGPDPLALPTSDETAI